MGVNGIFFLDDFISCSQGDYSFVFDLGRTLDFFGSHAFVNSDGFKRT